VVSVSEVLEIRSDHEDAVPSGEVSILYPVINAPPLFNGAIQDKSIVVVLVATAVRDEGTSGTVDALVVALATLDGLPVPPELMALTR